MGTLKEGLHASFASGADTGESPSRHLVHLTTRENPLYDVNTPREAPDTMTTQRSLPPDNFDTNIVILNGQRPCFDKKTGFHNHLCYLYDSINEFKTYR